MTVRYPALLFLILLPLHALAEGDVTCPSGQSLTTFADGNSVSQVCVDSNSGMEETVPSGAYAEGEEDPDNYD